MRLPTKFKPETWSIYGNGVMLRPDHDYTIKDGVLVLADNRPFYERITASPDPFTPDAQEHHDVVLRGSLDAANR